MHVHQILCNTILIGEDHVSHVKQNLRHMMHISKNFFNHYDEYQMHVIIRFNTLWFDKN